MPAGLMPAEIRPILKLSFTKDILRSSQLSVFRLPDCLLMPVNACGAALVLPRLIDASFSAGAGGFAVNMNIFLLFSPLKMAGFLRVKSGAGHHAGMAEERAFSRPVAVIYKAT